MEAAVLWTALHCGCAAPAASVAKTEPEPAPAPLIAKPATPVAKPAPPPPIIRESPPAFAIIVHQADLHGQFESKQGTTIAIRALLMMTKTQPAVGNKGMLYFAPADAKGDTEWIPLGDVEVKKPLDAAGKILVKIIDDEKKFMLPGSKKPTPLLKNTRLRLRWEW